MSYPCSSGVWPVKPLAPKPHSASHDDKAEISDYPIERLESAQITYGWISNVALEGNSLVTLICSFRHHVLPVTVVGLDHYGVHICDVDVCEDAQSRMRRIVGKPTILNLSKPHRGCSVIEIIDATT
jgi:hypothetical protein